MRIIEVIIESRDLEHVRDLARRQEIRHVWWFTAPEAEICSVRLLVEDSKRQRALDTLQSLLETCETAKIIILPVEAVWPGAQSPAEDGEEQETGRESASMTREELYYDVEKSARVDYNFFLLATLSTLVAAIGLMEDNVAVIIGAMVIAPLLGPNIALALATALGDRKLLKTALRGNLLGLGLAVTLGLLIGLVLLSAPYGPELLARTEAGLDSAALALASGAAAALSLTTGLSSVLVGVMVAVALLPPAATVGLMLGEGRLDLAWGAALLLALNIVCLNLAANLVFLFKGITPREWMSQRKARLSNRAYLLFWTGALLVLLAIILARGLSGR